MTFLGVPCALSAQEPPPAVTPPPQVRTDAQEAAVRLGHSVTNAQIADAIHQRGFTADVVRVRDAVGRPLVDPPPLGASVFV